MYHRLSGIFQAAEDLAVLCLYNACDCFNLVRLKHPARTDLSGLRLEFDIDYEYRFDRGMNLGPGKHPA